MNKTDVSKALDDLDGIIAIAKNEMLVHGLYVSSVVSKKLKEKGAICGGRNACLIGSLYLAHGVVKSSDENDTYDPRVPGVNPDERPAYMRNRRGLKLAYNYLNDAAKRYIDKHHHNEAETIREDRLKSHQMWGTDLNWPPSEGWGEFLFEDILGDDSEVEMNKAHNETRETIIKVVRNAKRQLKKDYAEVLNA